LNLQTDSNSFFKKVCTIDFLSNFAYRSFSIFIMKDTREYIIDEAYRLFLNHSYEAVSISMISDAIGLTKGALYHHFKNKEELYRAVIDKHFPITSVTVDLDNITMEEYTSICIDHTHKILKAIFGNEEKFIPVNYLSLIADCFRHYEGFSENKAQVIEGAVKDVAVVLKNAINRGEIRGDINVEVVALQYFSLSIGLAGDLIRNSSVKSAMKALTDQLNQLYYLLKK
jgi:TetR/AcrR family transcriptional regulator, transcriptional repressor for nem operon